MRVAAPRTPSDAEGCAGARPDSATIKPKKNAHAAFSRLLSASIHLRVFLRDGSTRRWRSAEKAIVAVRGNRERYP
jgi:hypothetical protein